jgi:hypothetical protein
MTVYEERIDTRVPGIALLATALFAVFTMAHHPTAGGISDFAVFARNAERISTVNAMVHGTVMVLVAVLSWTVIALAMRRGLQRPLVMLGLVAWTIGAAAMIVAPSFNGFVLMDIARRAFGAPDSGDALRVVFQTLTAWITVIAVIGALATSAAIVLWSGDLLRTRGAVRWVGVGGLVAGAAPIAALALQMTGAVVVLAGWPVWFVAVGVLMIRRKV